MCLSFLTMSNTTLPTFSAYSSKQDRPMKYETTRPVSGSKSRSDIRPSRQSSASSTSSSKRASGPNVKVQGSKVTPNEFKLANKTQYSAMDSINKVNDENTFAVAEPTPQSQNSAIHVKTAEDLYDDYDASSDEFEYPEKPEIDPSIAHLLRVDVKKPESVIQYEQDMENLKEMEAEFQRTTLNLQKQLGIPPEGMV